MIKIFFSLGLFCLMSTQALDEMKLETDFIKGIKKITIDLQKDYLQESCDLIKQKNYIVAANMTILGALSADQDSINALCQLNYQEFSKITGFLDENFNSIYKSGKPIDFTLKDEEIFKHLFKMRETLKDKYMEYHTIKNINSN